MFEIEIVLKFTKPYDLWNDTSAIILEFDVWRYMYIHIYIYIIFFSFEFEIKIFTTKQKQVYFYMCVSIAKTSSKQKNQASNLFQTHRAYPIISRTSSNL